MSIAEYTDIKMSEDWKLTAAASGDAPIATGVECLLQDIRLEAVTQEGELFYDTDYGWSLLDFIQREDDELTRLEIKNRIRKKLKTRTEIDKESVTTEVTFDTDSLCIRVTFRVEGESYSITVNLSRVSVEVTTDD